MSVAELKMNEWMKVGKKTNDVTIFPAIFTSLNWFDLILIMLNILFILIFFFSKTHLTYLLFSLTMIITMFRWMSWKSIISMWICAMFVFTNRDINFKWNFKLIDRNVYSFHSNIKHFERKGERLKNRKVERKISSDFLI